MSIESCRIIEKFLADDTWAASKSSPLALSRDGRRVTRCFFEGPSLYSYGKHFELARKVRLNGHLHGQLLLVNMPHATSQVTNEQLNDVRRYAPQHKFEVLRCDLADLPASNEFNLEGLLANRVTYQVQKREKEWEERDEKRKEANRKRAAQRRADVVGAHRESLHWIQTWLLDGQARSDFCDRLSALDGPGLASHTVALLLASAAGMEDRIRADHARNAATAKSVEVLLGELFRAAHDYTRAEHFIGRIVTGTALGRATITPEQGRARLEVAIQAAVALNQSVMAENHARVADFGVLGAGRNIAKGTKEYEVARES